jgi:hypothetical protein
MSRHSSRWTCRELEHGDHLAGVCVDVEPRVVQPDAHGIDRRPDRDRDRDGIEVGPQVAGRLEALQGPSIQLLTAPAPTAGSKLDGRIGISLLYMLLMTHTLQVRTGRYSSPERTFDAVDGGNISFRCNGAILWPQYVASLLVPTIGLRLHQ